MGTPEVDDLLGQLRPRVFRQAVASLGDPDSAEDICQEVLLAVFLGRPSFKGTAKVTSWVYRITSNAIGSHLRRKACEERARETWVESTPRYQSYESPGQDLDLRTVLGMVKDLSNGLPSAQREAVRLNLQGYRTPAIAAARRVCPGTIRANLHRARTIPPARRR